jgi:hypothetical protein
MSKIVLQQTKIEDELACVNREHPGWRAFASMAAGAMSGAFYATRQGGIHSSEARDDDWAMTVHADTVEALVARIKYQDTLKD